MNKKRCSWATDVENIYVKYHDEEWGVPTHDDRELFEFLVLTPSAGLPQGVFGFPPGPVLPSPPPCG